MTKKKLVALVLVCAFVFFGGASYLNFKAAKKYVLNDMILAHNVTIQEVHDAISLFYKCEDKYSAEDNLINLHENLCNTPLFSFYNSEHMAYAYVLTDRQGNIILKSESGVWLDNGAYIPLDKYLTPEIKNDLIEFNKKTEGDRLMANEVNLGFNGSELIPVSIIFDDEISSSREENNKYLTVSFNDHDIAKTFNAMTLELYNLYDDEAFEDVNAMLEEELENFDYLTNHKRSVTIYSEDTYFPVIETEGDYHFIGYAKYKPFNKALTSEFFYNQMITTALIFVILTAVVLAVAITIFNKSCASKKKQQETVSVDVDEPQAPRND